MSAEAGPSQKAIEKFVMGGDSDTGVYGYWRYSESEIKPGKTALEGSTEPDLTESDSSPDLPF